MKNIDSCGDIMTIDDVRSILGIGRNATYNMIHNGIIRGFRLGRTFKIPKSEVVDFIFAKTIQRAQFK